MTTMDCADSFANKKVLITGGLGFIGSNLAIRLADCNAEVLVMDSLIPELGGNPRNLAGYEARIRTSATDIRDTGSVQELIRGQDYIFHLAAQVSHTHSMRNPFDDLDINCRGTMVLLEACQRYHPDAKIVFAGTRQVYGKPEYLPVDERHPLSPTDINGIHKLASEQYFRLAWQAHRIPAVRLRMTNVYGPRMHVQDNQKNFIGWWIRQILDGRPITIYGDGAQLRDFNFISDVEDALLLTAAHPVTAGEVYNLGSHPPHSLADVAKLLVEINGGGEIEYAPFPPDRKRIEIGSYYADYRKIQDALGWAPTVDLREGLTRTLAFFREHRSRYW